ncbi:UDP-N-acetylmuramoyl-tripeptide--D-alanyl-D-alanine ligase [Blastococcus sp. Marseille-P5729]|uniref:UDP-N-acetylmuramoyl-tripeptide--D-alanyl-D- alanine ligase n=1 Tax=Blastococcus sp. Marseille-P5729 TaxID=2086582 RepID=UPI000D0FA6F6|nr:UDP-N-acetylmuramoyl-tripeptide--D-alanyl-D-alanine ligase [Blastococcus sp. Marseille-P5729]
MRFTTSDIAQATSGELVGADVEASGASIDSRSVGRGQLFVPIVAERDGHDFVPGAIESGAAAYLASRPVENVDAPVVRVGDTAQALMDLGRAARARLPERVIGVTGSVGKTSTKDLLAAVLRTTYTTAANERSFNNELGLPLTLLNAPDDAEAAVVEMGARGIGHIELLCSIAQPTVGIVTYVGDAHMELFGTVDAVAQAKGELVEALPHSGLAVLSADQEVVSAMASRTRADVLTFGRSVGADVTAANVVLDETLRPAFTLQTPWGSADLQLAVRGEHQLFNALAAAAAAGGVGVPFERIAAGLTEAEISGLRMQLERAPSGALVLNDAYNANPTSMNAGLDALLSMRARRRFAVVGVMAELGDDAARAHREIADRAAGAGVTVIAVDAADYGTAATHALDVDSALEILGALGEGDAVLVKGSRVAALERVAERLLGGDHAPTNN